MRRVLSLCLLLVLLTGCVSAPAESTAPTTVPTTVPTEPTTLPPETTAPVQTEPETGLKTGYYLLTLVDSNGQRMEGEVLMNAPTYIQLRDNNSGTMSTGGMMEPIDWARGFIVAGRVCKYTFEEDILVLERFSGYQMTFEYCGDTLPEAYRVAPLQVGTYLIVSATAHNGDVTFYNNPSILKGYLKLEPDFTGELMIHDETASVNWADDNFIVRSSPVVYQFDPELGILTLSYCLDYESILLILEQPPESPDSSNA